MALKIANKKCKFINLTPHDIFEVKSKTHIPKSDNYIRLDCRTTTSQTHCGIEIKQTTFEKLTNLPPQTDGVIYIVSALALNMIPMHRTDFVSPGNVERNDQGKPIGCNGFRIRAV